MSKLILLMFTWALVLSAGVVVGRLSVFVPLAAQPAPPPPSTRPHPWWSDQLGLTSDQRQQFDAIWSDTRQKMNKLFDGRRDLDHQREQAIRNLFPSDDLKAQYDQVLLNYRNGREDLDKQRQKLIDDADERSRAVLTDQQKTKWDAQSKQWHERRGPGGPGGPGGGPGQMGGPPMQRPTTRPNEWGE